MLHGPTIWQESNSITKDLDGKNKTRPIDNEWSRVDQIDLIGTKYDVKRDLPKMNVGRYVEIRENGLTFLLIDSQVCFFVMSPQNLSVKQTKIVCLWVCKCPREGE